MLKETKRILFATDLSKECQMAYDYAVSLALSCQGSITLLHVIESSPDSVENLVKNLLGEDRYVDIMAKHEQDTRSILIGKRKESDIVQAALFTFCEEAGKNQAGCYLQPDEILILHGDIVKTIVATATEKKMDLIVMSAHKSILSSDTSVTKVAKGILRHSKIPILIVPPQG
jgi:nucleotide-binding universal stress UspA family protein